ncbi:MAG: epoxyqueuosine reductase QueH [Sphaerochaetaceae bacterium]|nr:epoxyqueuosine reductase QueH [Sphaerochaetaceae bacterium]
MIDNKENGKRILLHCCCAPCSTTCVERLIEEGYQVILWFSNDNIYPQDENNKRFGELIKLAQFHNLEVLRNNYNHEAWLDRVKGYEDEKEGGERCSVCFDYNLSMTQEKAKELSIKYFTTTLTVSRYKNSLRIFEIGNKYTGFVEKNFKKKDGYAKSIQLSKELGLYRQKYCGCEFSLRDALKYEKEKAEKLKNNNL